MTKLTQIIILFSVFNIFSQEKTQLKGYVFSKNNPLNQVHIYNVTTSKGVLSNQEGTFLIYVAVNDVLVINALPYKEIKLTITKEIFNFKKIKIDLIEEVTELSSVEVTNKKLIGNLLLDAKKAPQDINKNYAIKMDMKNYDLSLIPDTGSGADRGNNEENNMTPVGGNILGLVGLLVDVIRPKKHVRKKPNTFSEKETPQKIRAELGDKFFINELHIPKPHIDDFLEEYCKTKEFIDLYEENKIIECIALLIKKMN